jgi:predicted O-methyltransferase YrrM
MSGSLSAKQIFKSWQRSGRHPALVSLAGRLYHLPRHTRHLLRTGAVLRRLKATEGEHDPDQVVSLTLSEFHGVLKPLQVESEFRQMIRLAAHVRARRVVEIGTANGATLFALTRVAADDAVVVSVDLPGGLFGGGYPAWKKTIYSRFARPAQRVHLLRANSHEEQTFERVRQLTGSGSVDILFIDGDHTYEGVRADFLRYRELVRPGGLIFFHDIIKNTFDPGVQVDRFWRELVARKWLDGCKEFVQDHQQGLAGIGVGVVPATAAGTSGQ